MKFFPLALAALSLGCATFGATRAADPPPDPLALQLHNLDLRRAAPPSTTNPAE